MLIILKTLNYANAELWHWNFMILISTGCFKMCIFCVLRMALTEISVLQDVLNITKQKHYMVLDTVSAETPEARTGLHLYAKKRVSHCSVCTGFIHMLHTHVYKHLHQCVVP